MKLTLITYNVDGLPEQLDLRELPWPLKPISWLYKAFKGTTLITVNDGKEKAVSASGISRMLSQYDADIVALQEDFNFHKELLSELPSHYNKGTHSGAITLKELRWPIPHFDCDGLGLLTKGNIIGEHIHPWKESCGYFSHANDRLVRKGFRRYLIRLDNRIIDVYVVHMDADFGDNNKKDIATREAQMRQLGNYVNPLRPSIIIGDFNTTDVSPLTDALEEKGMNTQVIGERVDKVILCNPLSATCFRVNYHKYIETYLSDHRPLFVEIELC